MSEAKTFDQELAELEAEESERNASIEQSAKERRHLELTLSKRFTAELGPRGKDFELVNTDFGVFGVRVPDPLKYKIFLDRMAEGPEIAHQFVTTCLIYPKIEEFNAIGSGRLGLSVHCANAACKLAGLLIEKKVGK